MSVLKISQFSTNLVFRSRPESIPADLRPLWRISIVLLILKLTSVGNKSSLKRLFWINWAIQSEENQEKFLLMLMGKISPETILVRYDPSLTRALDYAHGENLVDYISGNRVQLTMHGMEAVTTILKNDDLFIREIAFLQKVGKKSFTEKKCMDILVDRE